MNLTESLKTKQVTNLIQRDHTKKLITSEVLGENKKTDPTTFFSILETH